MLQAIKKSQIKLEICEDSLTSSVFGLLLYLPLELFEKILKHSSYENQLPKQFGKLNNYEFWPHWNPTGTSNKNYIEPDVFIDFENFNIIIEAKRWDYKQQRLSQWRDQFQAYINEYEESHKSKDIYLFAIGGIGEEDCELIKIGDHQLHIVKCNWFNILREVVFIKRALTKSEHILNNIDSIIRILDDIILCFEIHGFFTGEWLDTIPFTQYKIKKEYRFEDILLSRNIFTLNIGNNNTIHDNSWEIIDKWKI